MGTQELMNAEVSTADTATATHNNANTATTAQLTTTTSTTIITSSNEEENHVYLPKASPPPQVIIIPTAPATTIVTNAAKKVRRAFSMPRNPFRWSRKFKTSTSTGVAESECSLGYGSNSAITSCVGGGRGRAGSIVSLSSYEAISKDSNGKVQSAETDATLNVDEKRQTRNPNKKNGIISDGSTNVTGSLTFGSNRILRRSSFRKFLNRIAQHVSSTVNVGANKHGSSTLQQQANAMADRVPPIGGYQWPPDQTPGVMGLKNHGNTCFMNAVLQCLSHTDILAEYFVLDQYKADLKRRNKINSRKFGTKGELTEQLANVLKALWTCKNESEHSTSFKTVVERYGSQFRSSTQHDAQEFLFWLLDKVHEDLNTATKRRYKSVKNNYGRPDEIIAAETLANHIRCNNSFVQAVFQAQFRSSLTCPRCKKQSNTFDPFHCISVQLPQLTQQTIFVTVVYLKLQPRQVKLGLIVPAGSPIVALRDQLQSDTGISRDRMVLVDINSEGFTRVFYDTQPVSTLNGIETIFCIEVPETDAALINATTSATNSKAEENSTTTSSIPSQLLLLVANVRKKKKKIEDTEDAENNEENVERFGAPFSMLVSRDYSFSELQKSLLREMAPLLKPEVFSYVTPLTDMFQIRLQDPSADPDTYLEQVEHPLLTEMIDLALSVLSSEAGPAHIKFLLEWTEPEQYFLDLSNKVVEHDSFSRLMEKKSNDTVKLTLEQCLEHYTKAETLSAEDAWRCPHCQQYLPVVKTLGLWSLPDILVVHFKRFRQHHEKGANAAKLTTMVQFPLNAFDMSPHLARGVNGENSSSLSSSLSTETAATYRPNSGWKKSRMNGGTDSKSSTLNSRENLETRYDLYAVCYHQGDTLETGHYTAACKNPYDRQWYKFDDQRVTKVPNESIQGEIINNEAYMLFYQRRTNETTECSGSSSNSGDHWVSRIAPPPITLQPTVEKVTVDENKENENPVESSDVVVVSPIEIEPAKPESKAVPIPNIIEEAAKEDAITTTTEIPKEDLVIESKKLTENDLSNVEDLSYADADDGNIENPTNDESKKEKSIDDSLEIFVMDEDTTAHLKEDLEKEKIIAAITPELAKSQFLTLPTAAVVPQPTALKLSPLVTESTVITVNTNGLITPKNIIKSQEKPNSNSTISSTSSSSSSTSSLTTPCKSAVSSNDAPTYELKYNGTALKNNYKDVALLSSSLKSNSSSIISAAMAAQNHEFQLSRQQHWNGSRSSVSAVENASQQHTHNHNGHHGLNLRHSFSTSSNYKLRECNETLSTMLRNSANTCSKDTLIFNDQQSHHHNHHHHHHSLMEDEDDTFMGSRSLWISPVTPHKLITVSPKN